MELTNQFIECPDCGETIAKSSSACPNCGCPISNNSVAINNYVASKNKIIGIIICIVSVICFIFGVTRLTHDDYQFYIEHCKECQENYEEVQATANSYSFGYFKSSYQDIADLYLDMIKDDKKEYWKFRIEAIVSFTAGGITLIFGIKNLKRNEM